MEETLIRVATYTNAGLLLLNIGLYAYHKYRLKKINKKEVVAYFYNKKTSQKEAQKTLGGGVDTFKHKNKQYVVNEKNIVEVGNTQALFYISGQSEPINILNKENSRLPADVLGAIMEFEHSKKINNYAESLLANLTPKQIVIGLAVVGMVIYLFMG